MEAQGHQTREAWLNYIAERIAPVFENLGAPLLEPRNGFQTQYSRSAYAVGSDWYSRVTLPGCFNELASSD